MEDEPVKEKIVRYLDELAQVDPLVNGERLEEWGETPGPRMGEILRELFHYQLDHAVEDRDELRRYYEEELLPNLESVADGSNN
jgi:hypothetical protein